MRQVALGELFAQFKRSIELLEASGPNQIAWLRANTYPIDELVQTFLDQLHAFSGRLQGGGLLTPSSLEALKQLSDLLTGYLKAEDAPVHPMWSDAGLQDGQEWQAIRALARRALAELGAGREA